MTTTKGPSLALIIGIVTTLTLTLSCKRQSIFNGGCFKINDPHKARVFPDDLYLNIYYNPFNATELILETHVSDGVAAFSTEIVNYNSENKEKTKIYNNGEYLQVAATGRAYFRSFDDDNIYVSNMDGTVISKVNIGYFVSNFAVDPKGEIMYCIASDSATAKGSPYLLRKNLNSGIEEVIDSIWNKKLQFVGEEGRLYYLESFDDNSKLYSYDPISKDVHFIVSAQQIRSSDKIVSVEFLHDSSEEMLIQTKKGLFYYNIVTEECKKLKNNCESKAYFLLSRHPDDNLFCGILRTFEVEDGQYAMKTEPFTAHFELDRQKLEISFFDVK